MHNPSPNHQRNPKYNPDVYSLLSWKDTTSLCQYDTFDEYLKAECKQLICLNQTLKNKVKSQEASIQYLLKTIESKDFELQKASTMLRKDMNIKTAKKGTGIQGQLGNLFNVGMLTRSINQEFTNQYPDYGGLNEQNKKLIERINSQEVEISNLKSRNMELSKELELTEHEVSNLKQKLMEQMNISTTIQKISKTLEQKKDDSNLTKTKPDSGMIKEIESLKEQLKEKITIIYSFDKQQHQLQMQIMQYKKIAELEAKRSEFLSKNILQLTSQYKNDKKKLESNIYTLQGQLEKEEHTQFYLPIYNNSMDKAEIKIIQSCESQQSDYENFSKNGKRVGSIKTKSLRENQKEDIHRLIDRYYQIKANNF